MSVNRSGYSEDYLRNCEALIDSALKFSPAYSNWRQFDKGGDVFERFSSLPILDKAMMRAFGPEGFVPAGRDLKAAIEKGEIEIVNTSGSTGDRVSNVWCQTWWNASEESSWKLNKHAAGVCTGKHREAILSSPLCVGFPCEDAYLSTERRSLGRFLFLNERVDPSKWADSHMRRMVSELNEFKPEVIEANPSYLAHLCNFMLKEGLKAHKPSLIVFTYENPSMLHRRRIDNVFGAPMASSYGSTEAGYVFMQCECGQFHQNVEHCHVDFIPFAEEQGGPDVGSIIVSTFDNPWRNLLRFDIGDVVKIAKDPCPCGRNDGLTLKSIEGRAVNLTKTRRGHLVTQAELDRNMSHVVGLAEYQLLQIAQSTYELHFTAEPGFTDSSIESQLKLNLEKVYGSDCSFKIVCVEGLSPDHPGKYRLSKSLFEIDVREFWDPALLPPKNILK